MQKDRSHQRHIPHSSISISLQQPLSLPWPLSLCLQLGGACLCMHVGVCCACLCVCVTHFGLFPLCCRLFFSLCPLHSGVLGPFFSSLLLTIQRKGFQHRLAAQGETFFPYPASFTHSLLKLLSCLERVEQVAGVSGCECLCVCVCCGLREGQQNGDMLRNGTAGSSLTTTSTPEQRSEVSLSLLRIGHVWSHFLSHIPSHFPSLPPIDQYELFIC